MKPIGSILKNACPDCEADMILRNSKYGLFYGCINFPECTSAHGAHKDTGEPLGIPADKKTKEWRMKAHEAFDQLWKKYGYKRKESYKLLQTTMGMTSEQAHIGRFDIEQCKKLIQKLEGI